MPENFKFKVGDMVIVGPNTNAEEYIGKVGKVTEPGDCATRVIIPGMCGHVLETNGYRFYTYNLKLAILQNKLDDFPLEEE